MLFLLFQKFIFLGCLGILIENLFTGLWSLAHRHWKLTTNSYLWMYPIYGLAGIMLDALRQALPWPFWLKALVYLPLIYGLEALSGLILVSGTTLLQRWFGGAGGGVVPWEYKKSIWSPLGLINLSYAPFWFILALGFDWIAAGLQKVVVFIGTQV